jgi:hypothetical protein
MNRQPGIPAPQGGEEVNRVLGSAERFSAMFSVPLVFRATRIRGG